MKRWACLGGVIAGLTCAPVALGGPDPTPCRNWCSRTITVGEAPVRWQSKQRFRRGDVLLVSVRIRRREVLVERRSGCKTYRYGSGVSAKVSTCGRLARVRVRAVSVEGTRRVEVRYRVVD